MGMAIDDIKHCLKVMVDCEVCEECNLYGTTGTDHCEHDCVYGALDIIDKYQKMQSDYETRLKAEREKIAEDVADKMDYMGSCLNEKNIILGIITGKRETLDSLCSTCKSESCVSNGTAISKADYENRLKADMVAMLTDIQLEIEELDASGNDWSYMNCSEVIQQKINALKENTDEKN